MTNLSEHYLNDLERTKLAATLYEEMRTRKMAPDNELFGRLVTIWTEQVRRIILLYVLCQLRPSFNSILLVCYEQVVSGHNGNFPRPDDEGPQSATGWLPLGRLRYQDGNLELDLHSLSAKEARAAVLSTLKALKDQRGKSENQVSVRSCYRYFLLSILEHGCTVFPSHHA